MNVIVMIFANDYYHIAIIIRNNSKIILILKKSHSAVISIEQIRFRIP